MEQIGGMRQKGMKLKRAILIAGLTASGKSGFAIEVARRLGGVVVNADSMQVYSQLRVLTARPSPEDEARAPHRLYGSVSGVEAFSTGAWLALAEAEAVAAWDVGQVPIFAGGTGLYFEALTNGLAVVPQIPSGIRDKWRQYKDHSEAGGLSAELARRDPEMAERLKPGDSQRILRALEVIDATGRSLADWQRDAHSPSVLAGVDVVRLVLAPPRQTIYERCDARNLQMIGNGALDEVQALLAAEFSADAPVMKAIGVAELGAHLAGEMPLEDALEKMRTQTRRYAKRQLTWARGRMGAWTWVEDGEDGHRRLEPKLHV